MENVFGMIKVIVFMVIMIVCICSCAWFICSYVDVVIHNTNIEGGTILHSWNLFEIFLQK